VLHLDINRLKFFPDVASMFC